MTMENDLIPQDFAGASDGMLPTTSCSLPSSSGISFLRLATDRCKEKRLLPFGRLSRSIKPRIGRLARTAKGGNDLSGGKLGKRFSEGHGQILPLKKKSAMQKIVLALCPQCRHLTCMKTLTTITKAEWESMKTIAEATKSTGKIKSRNGSKYEWVAGGKRITVKKI